MNRLKKKNYSDDALIDFGYNSRILKLSIDRHNDNDPTIMEFTLATDGFEKSFVCRSPEDIVGIGSFYEGWSIRIYDLNKIEGFHHDFGRFIIEFMDDEDDYPLWFTVDAFDEA